MSIVTPFYLLPPSGPTGLSINGTHINSAPIRFSSSYTPSNSYDFATKLYADLNGVGPDPQTQLKIFYVTSAGTRSGFVADGLTIDTAFNDFAVAVATVTNLVPPPSITNRIVIYCPDAGNFMPSTQKLILPNFVSLIAPNATFLPFTDTYLTFTLGKGCNLVCDSLGTYADFVATYYVNITIVFDISNPYALGAHIACNRFYGSLNIQENSMATLDVFNQWMGNLSCSHVGGSVEINATSWRGLLEIYNDNTFTVSINTNGFTPDLGSIIRANSVVNIDSDIITRYQNLTVSENAILRIKGIETSIPTGTTAMVEHSTVPINYTSPVVLLPISTGSNITFVNTADNVNSALAPCFVERVGNTVHICIATFQFLFTSDGTLVTTSDFIIDDPFNDNASNTCVACLDTFGGTNTLGLCTVSLTFADGLLRITGPSGAAFVTGHRYIIGPAIMTFVKTTQLPL